MKHWSTSVWIMTVFYILVMIAFFFLGSHFKTHELRLSDIWWAFTATGAVFLCGLAYTVLVYPFRIWVENRQIRVKRVIKPLKIAFDDINRIKVLTDIDKKRFYKVAGNGGLAGYTGEYRCSTLGRFSLSAYNLKNLILIELKSGKRYVFSYDPTDISATSLTNLSVKTREK